MATALQTLNMKAMSLASGYGRWQPSRSTGDLLRSSFQGGGSYIDTTPGKVKLFNHNPERPLGLAAQGSFAENYLYEKGLKLNWYAWPMEDCMSHEFTAAWVETLNTGANALKRGESKMGCEFCRQEPLADAEKTPTQMSPEVVIGNSQTMWKEGVITPKMSSAELRKALEEAEQAEVEVTASVLTEESRAAVDSGAPKGLTELPSALSNSTPPVATKPRLAECPTCHKPGKGRSAKKRSSSVYAHLKGHPDHAETPTGVSV
tara:strand:- start:18 stop:803 length:786 start_codon:yes stop_codon:yes gene_type:complete